jgi:K+-sensing histidine kinase KdpD
VETSAIAVRLRSRPVLIGAGLLGPLVAAAILGAVRDEVTTATAVLVLVVVVAAVSTMGYRAAGLLAAISSAVWFDFFLTSPYHQFTISDADDVEVAVLLVVIGGIVGELALWGIRQEARAARRSGYLDGVLKVARAVAEDRTPSSVLTSIVAKQIEEILGVSNCRYVEGPVHDPRMALLGQDGVFTRGGHEVDVARHGLPTDEELAVPVLRGSLTYGYYAFNSATRLSYPTAEQLRVAVLLADQTAAVFAERG